ncbi:uncharacterized protein LOC141729652 [Zonotrichia albicollis]|uniref:uncharacterized protein LOC141729652 n=1 Tax=Zonotrichia albicollis TaxID=44394 RepID=UPI003D80BC73
MIMRGRGGPGHCVPRGGRVRARGVRPGRGRREGSGRAATAPVRRDSGDKGAERRDGAAEPGRGRPRVNRGTSLRPPSHPWPSRGRHRRSLLFPVKGSLPCRSSGRCRRGGGRGNPAAAPVPPPVSPFTRCRRETPSPVEAPCTRRYHQAPVVAARVPAQARTGGQEPRALTRFVRPRHDAGGLPSSTGYALILPASPACPRAVPACLASVPSSASLSMPKKVGFGAKLSREPLSSQARCSALCPVRPQPPATRRQTDNSAGAAARGRGLRGEVPSALQQAALAPRRFMRIYRC